MGCTVSGTKSRPGHILRASEVLHAFVAAGGEALSASRRLGRSIWRVRGLASVLRARCLLNVKLRRRRASSAPAQPCLRPARTRALLASARPADAYARQIVSLYARRPPVLSSGQLSSPELM